MKNAKSVRKQVAQIAGETLTRQAHIEEVRQGDDGESREVVLAFSSEEPVGRWFGLEILRHDEGSANLERVQNGTAGVLFAHGRDNNFGIMPVGRVVEAWIDGNDRKGRARVVFDEDEKSDQVWQKVRSGTLKGVSFGYRWGSYSYEFVESGEVSSDGRYGPYEEDAVLVRKWEVLEISLEPVPADATVGVGRSYENQPPEPEVREEPEGETPESEGGEREMDEKELERIRKEAADAARKEAEERAKDLAQEERAAERKRVSEIWAIAEKHNVKPENARQWVDEGTSLDEVRKVILDKQYEEREAISAAEVTVDEKDKLRTAMEVGIMSRVNFLAPKITDDERKSGYEDFAGMPLMEIARDCLRREGIRVPRHPMEMVGRAMATDDFPYVLGSIANKSVLSGWEGAPEQWKVCFDTGSVSNFHIHTAARVGELEDLDEIPEHGEYKYGEASEAFEQYQVATYGKLFAITRQAIINDDLGQIAELPMKRGEAAARKVGDLAWAQITSNPAMGDGNNLFDASNHNNHADSGAVPSVTTIAAAIEAMKLQKDISENRRLNIRPEFFVAPVGLEATAEQFFNTELIGGATNQPNLHNPYASMFTRIYEPRLDDATDDVAWYLLGPKGKTVKVFFLYGVEAPYLETKQGWNMDGVEYKVRIDVGAKAMDWRAFYKNDGEA